MKEQALADKIKAKDLSKKITKEYMDEAFHAREMGKLVVYTTAQSPVEIFVTHNIIPVYPENHAVACLTSRLGTELSLAMENLGYTSHLCAYARCDLGYRETGKSGTQGIPEPDLLFACNAQCFTLTKWFQVLSRRVHIPMFVWDTPEWIRNDEAREEIVKYAVMQLKELIAWLEDITKRKFDHDRLKEVIKYSAQTSLLYRKFLDFASYKPSPINIFDALIAMAITVYRRGTPEAVSYYEILCSEIYEERISKGIGVIPNEKYRLYWENLPVWYKFRDHANLLGSYGGTILTSLYVHDWGYQFDLNKDPLLTLAENYVRAFSNLTLEDRAQKALGLFTKYDLNGMIMFMNRSCKAVSFAVPTLKDILTKKTGLPALIFESDMGDPRFYSETQIRTRIEAYFETLDRFHFSREAN